MNPRDYVIYMLGEENESSILWRAKNPFLISCCLDILAEKDGDLFVSGSQSIEFTNDVIGVCGTEDELGMLVGQTLEVEVTNLSDTTNYDQMIFFDKDTNPFDKDQWVYVRNNDTKLNFLHVEGDVTDLFASSISYDKSTEDAYFQYVSKNSNVTSVYRIFLDPVADLTRYFFSDRLSDGKDVYVSLASTVSDQTQVSVSMNWSGYRPMPYDMPPANANSCVNATTGVLIDDGIEECTDIGISTHYGTGASTLRSNANSWDQSAVVTDAAAGDLADNLPSFDGDTILSQSSLGL